jgi:hypothetical protein
MSATLLIPTQTEPSSLEHEDEQLGHARVPAPPPSTDTSENGNGPGGPGNHGPPDRGPHKDHRPPRPPRWQRLIFWVFLYMFAFAIGWMIGGWGRSFERRVWGTR